MKFPVLLVAVSASFFAQSVVADVVHIAREEVGIVPRVPAVYYPTTTTTTQKSVSTVKPSTSTSASECVAPIWGQCGGGSGRRTPLMYPHFVSRPLVDWMHKVSSRLGLHMVKRFLLPMLAQIELQFND
ncbi:hypothetical protein FRC15_009243 [Serendipita sp. 397]|nr:hypothetical protein FRC15_009243 [Serendipita sp. 397]